MGEDTVPIKAAFFTTEARRKAEEDLNLGETAVSIKAIRDNSLQGFARKDISLHLTSPGGRRISSKSAGRVLQIWIEIHFDPES